MRSCIGKEGKSIDLIELIDRFTHHNHVIIYGNGGDGAVIIFEEDIDSCKEKCHDRHEVESFDDPIENEREYDDKSDDIPALWSLFF